MSQFSSLQQVHFDSVSATHLSGSLQTLCDGTSYLRGTDGITVTTASSGQVTISPSGLLLRSISFSLDANDTGQLNSSPYTILPPGENAGAPSDQTDYEAVQLSVFFYSGSAGYDGDTSTLEVQSYYVTPGDSDTVLSVSADFATGTVDRMLSVYPSTMSGSAMLIYNGGFTAFITRGLCLTSHGDWYSAAGDGTLKCELLYRIRPGWWPVA